MLTLSINIISNIHRNQTPTIIYHQHQIGRQVRQPLFSKQKLAHPIIITIMVKSKNAQFGSIVLSSIISIQHYHLFQAPNGCCCCC
jgi:hypothetical protein